MLCGFSVGVRLAVYEINGNILITFGQKLNLIRFHFSL